jgi:hypothetical protein
LRCGASEGGDPLLSYELFVSFDEFGSPFGDACLEFFIVSLYLLFEPALLVSQPFLLRCTGDGIE